MKTSRSPRPLWITPAAREFTLIELLVVIAIIVVLASMLLPALGRADAGHCESRMLKAQFLPFTLFNPLDLR